MSLRTRLLLGILALVSVGLLAADVATYRFLRSSLIERVDERLAAGTFSAARALSDGDGVGRDGGPDHPPGGDPFDLLPSGTYAAFLDPDGGVIQETSLTFGEE